MNTFKDCITIYLACQANRELFKCENCPCSNIEFRDGDKITDICDSLYSLERKFNYERVNNGE